MGPRTHGIDRRGWRELGSDSEGDEAIDRAIDVMRLSASGWAWGTQSPRWPSPTGCSPSGHNPRPTRSSDFRGTTAWPASAPAPDAPGPRRPSRRPGRIWPCNFVENPLSRHCAQSSKTGSNSIDRPPGRKINGYAGHSLGREPPERPARCSPTCISVGNFLGTTGTPGVRGHCLDETRRARRSAVKTHAEAAPETVVRAPNQPLTDGAPSGALSKDCGR